MTFSQTPIFEIVRVIDLQPPGETGFCMLIGPSPDPQTVLDFRDELEVQDVGSLVPIDVANSTLSVLLEEIASQQDAVILLHGFDAWSNHQFASLDINRSAFETGKFLLFWMNSVTAGRFLDTAPNMRSFLGGNIFAAAPGRSQMSREEIDDRLGQLRSCYGLTDAEVIERAMTRALPSDPQFVEWLVLLGRSTLAG